MRAELLRARRERRAASVLAVTLENARKLRRAAGEEGELAGVAAVFARLRESLGDAEVVGYAEPAGFVLLLPRVGLENALAAARRAIDGLRESGIELDGHALPLRVCAGVADGARDGVRFVETLIEVAAEGAAVAEAGGGNRCVHTELYDIVEARLERELPEEARREPPQETAPPLEPEPEPEPPVVREEIAPPPEEAAVEPLAPVAKVEPPAPVERVEEVAEEPKPVGQELPGRVEEELDEQVRAIVDRDSVERARRALVEDALNAARREWHAAANEIEAKHDKEIELLERRIAKLNAALAETEEMLVESRRAGEVDPGVASAFRAVQGLSFEEQDYELKRELMGMIFKANLELRSELSDN
jgi:GGDEF domain-containing protein